MGGVGISHHGNSTRNLRSGECQDGRQQANASSCIEACAQTIGGAFVCFDIFSKSFLDVILPDALDYFFAAKCWKCLLWKRLLYTPHALVLLLKTLHEIQSQSSCQPPREKG